MESRVTPHSDFQRTKRLKELKKAAERDAKALQREIDFVLELWNKEEAKEKRVMEEAKHRTYKGVSRKNSHGKRRSSKKNRRSSRRIRHSDMKSKW